MFALFFSLYLSMFVGSWSGLLTPQQIGPLLTGTFNELGAFLTSIFGDVQMMDLGTNLLAHQVNIGPNYILCPNYIILIAFILSLITSIGIVVMAVKGVKKAFGIFFMGIR